MTIRDIVDSVVRFYEWYVGHWSGLFGAMREGRTVTYLLDVVPLSWYFDTVLIGVFVLAAWVWLQIGWDELETRFYTRRRRGADDDS